MQSPFSSPHDAHNDPRFSHRNYTIKRKLLQAFGATFYLYDPQENMVLWASQKAFKLKEDLRLFADEAKTQEILRIGARSIMDFSAAYDVFDSRTNQKIGALKRRGLASTFLQDTWILMDESDREIGMIQEDSALLGVIRRFIDWATLLLPQKFNVTLTAPSQSGATPIAAPGAENSSLVSRPVGQFVQTKNPFSSRMTIDFSSDPNGELDRRLALAAAILIAAIEGKQR